MVAIPTYSPLERQLGWAKEPLSAVGTPVAPTGALPFDEFEFNDKWTPLPDMGIRGSMGNDAFDVAQGVFVCEIDIKGVCYFDQLGFLFANILGDVVTTGTPTTPTGMLSAAVNSLGATSVSSSVSIPSGTLIQIDVGPLAEIVTTSGAPTGVGPYTIPVPALAKLHASGVAITAIVAPNAHVFSLFNGSGGQPVTHTLTQFYGPTATTGTRSFSSFVCTELTVTWNAESEFVTYTAKGLAWPSASAARPTLIYTSAGGVASWAGVLGLAGPASGGTQVKSALSGEFSLKRSAKAYYTGQGSQTPYIIQRGGFSAGWKLGFIAIDEAPYTYMRNNTRPSMQFVASNGLAGAAALGFQLDSAKAAFEAAKSNNGSEAIQWDCSGRYLLNTTNAGYSGGNSPLAITLTNALPTGTYA
jgi:hypothetical protein